MEIGNWQIDKDILFLQDESGYRIIPEAEEIFNYFFFGNNVFIKNNKPTNFSLSLDSIKRLSFSEFPLDLVIALENQIDSGRIKLSINIQAIGNNIEYSINNFFNRMADHIIVDNKWYPFTRGAVEEIKNVLRDAGVSADTESITLFQFLRLRKLSSSNSFIHDKTVSFDTIDFYSIYQEEPGSLFHGNLYPYQKHGFLWLKWITGEGLGCILDDEMGLGKTIQVIALLANKKNFSPSLIIVPATLLENWSREIKKFAPTLRTRIHHGFDRTGFPGELRNFEVIITSYGTAVRDIYMLNMIEWNFLVLDEAQAIKNPLAQRTRGIKNIRRRTGIALTGTPLENRLTDLWSLTDFVIPGYLGDLIDFENDFSKGIKSAEDLEPVISPIILRRKVEEVAKDLPEKIEIPQYLVLDIKSAEVYENIRKHLQNKEQISLATIQKLRQFCTHPFLIENTDGDPADFSEKYHRLVEILEEIFDREQRVLIFTSYRRMIDILVKDIKDRFEVYCDYIDGRRKIYERQRIVDIFSSQKGSGALILNPRAAGLGLNIASANHVIHYNPEWNPAIEDQATARSYRRGQKRPVTIHKLFYVNTVEEVIMDRLERKRYLADTAVVGVDGKDANYDDLIKAINISPLMKVD